MNRFAVILAIALAGGAHAQTFITPSRALRPLTNSGNQPGQPASQYSQQAAPGQPAEVVARIDAGLAASKIALVGRVDGLKGTLYVTNVGQLPVSPSLRFAICDRYSAQIGAAVKTGAQLMPNNFEKIEVLATNLGAADLKLMKLTVKE